MADSKKQEIFEWFFVASSIVSFLIYKFSHLVLHFGDGNAYIYMAKVINGGALPFRDFFLADPPFMVYFLAFLKLFLRDNLILFQALPIVFEATVALLIFLILKKWTNVFSFLAPIFYLFSFSTISTSDYLTGVQLVVLLSVLAIYFWEKETPIFSGISWMLALLTKLYVLPALVGFIIFIFWKDNREKLKKMIYGAIGAFAFIMGPFLILFFFKVWNYLIAHQFGRPAGLDKWYVWNFFLVRGWPILFLGFAGILIAWRRVFVLSFAMIFVFFLVYQDLYYLYL